MGLGGAVGTPTGGACGIWTTAGNKSAAGTDVADDCAPSEVWEDRPTV